MQVPQVTGRSALSHQAPPLPGTEVTGLKGAGSTSPAPGCEGGTGQGAEVLFEFLSFLLSERLWYVEPCQQRSLLLK